MKHRFDFSWLPVAIILTLACVGSAYVASLALHTILHALTGG